MYFLKERLEHLDLIEGIIVDLLRVKWKTFIRGNFFRQIARFFVYFLISMFVFVGWPFGNHYTAYDLQQRQTNLMFFCMCRHLRTSRNGGCTEEGIQIVPERLLSTLEYLLFCFPFIFILRFYRY